MKKFSIHALVLKASPSGILQTHTDTDGAHSPRAVDARVTVYNNVHVKPNGAVKERDERGRLRVRDSERLRLRVRILYICKLKSVHFSKWRRAPRAREVSTWLRYLY